MAVITEANTVKVSHGHSRVCTLALCMMHRLGIHTSFNQPLTLHLRDREAEYMENPKAWSLSIPPEILHDIIGDNVAEYINLCITVVPAHDTTRSDHETGDEGDEGDGIEHGEDGLRWEELEAAERLPINFISPLLSVTHQFRDITNEILAKVLAIERRSDGRYSAIPFVLRAHFN
jgi:hypothetical protein